MERKPALMPIMGTSGFLRRGTSPVRQAFHPKPPTHGNEWVMWIGNVPEGATDDELWQFFQQPAPNAQSSSGATRRATDSTGDATDSPANNGVASIFLIKTSYCAFVNFDSEENLKRAVRAFNGIPLRPHDPTCPRLVCRRRRKDDDLRSGVAAQRGWGLHTNWIRMQAAAMKRAGFVPETDRAKEKAPQKTGAEDEVAQALQDTSLNDDADGEGGSPQIMVPPHLRGHDDPPTSPSMYLGPSSSSDPSPPTKGNPDRPGATPYQGSSVSSGSFASTNSSFLAKYFPKRYFILKSLTEASVHGRGRRREIAWG